MDHTPSALPPYTCMLLLKMPNSFPVFYKMEFDYIEIILNPCLYACSACKGLQHNNYSVCTAREHLPAK